MIGNLSFKTPENEKATNFYRNYEEWVKLTNKTKEYKSKVTDVPMIINGKQIMTHNSFDSINPSDLSKVAKVYMANSANINEAIGSALKAKQGWQSLDPKTRLLMFKDLENIVMDMKYDIMAAAMVECGYNAPEADGGFTEMVDFLRFNSHWYHEILQENPTDGNRETNFYINRPLKGFTTAITPFNFPIAIGYNLPTVMALTGNTVVWKPSSDAVLTSSLLMKAIKDAGFPDGVINMVPCPGSEFGENALKHPELTAVNFTGGYDTAWRINGILNGSGPRPHFPRLIAETGGKDFMWVDESAAPWVDDIAAQMIAGAYGRTGQKCSANSRAYVPDRMLDDLLESMVAQLEHFRTGDPTNDQVNMGPVINEAAFDKIVGYIKDAKEDPNCEIVFGGYHDKSSGFYIGPTIILVNDKNHRLMKEEIFGPVLAIHGYTKGEEMSTLYSLKDNDYKLTGSVYCKDAAKLERLLPNLANEAGNFYINRKTTGALVAQQPFGGDGASGTNRKAGSKDYLKEFISRTVVGYRHAPAPGKN